jgi:hypothetical protein
VDFLYQFRLFSSISSGEFPLSVVVFELYLVAVKQVHEERSPCRLAVIVSFCAWPSTLFTTVIKFLA